ncbi:CKLF-like MARVEL transmembrane domain-containing protein 8 [Aythya fuligula]|uniref:CKLF-like MARVEL transmembrane domain-containing protein 8 n=2 Tax=Neognathae TaxID=8825 RepID=A0A6J3CET0_AYTFU|nr:CKLF-like MARVEL transmembrane domain-containing protein 8 [Aythya fuligula]
MEPPPPPPPQEQPPRPRSHTVTTTSSSFTANLSASSSTLAYDREFLRTLPGLLMVAEIVLGLLVWTLIAGTEYFLYPAFGWVMFVAVFYWVLTVFFLIIYMTMTYTRIPQVPWTTVGLCFNGSAFILYLIAAIVDASSVTKELDSHNYNSWAASSISLLVAFISVNNSQWTNYSAYSYFQIVAMCDLVMVLFFYIIHIFRVYRMLTCVSWPLAEFLHYLIGTILLLIASIVAASKSYNVTGLVAGATFGFLATILCVLSIWSSYKVSCITQSTNAAV